MYLLYNLCNGWFSIFMLSIILFFLTLVIFGLTRDSHGEKRKLSPKQHYLVRGLRTIFGVGLAVLIASTGYFAYVNHLSWQGSTLQSNQVYKVTKHRVTYYKHIKRHTDLGNDDTWLVKLDNGRSRTVRNTDVSESPINMINERQIVTSGQPKTTLTYYDKTLQPKYQKYKINQYRILNVKRYVKGTKVAQ